MPTFDDACDKRKAAEESLKDYRYADAIFHAQECIEFSIKAFLQALGIMYEPKHELKVHYFRDALEKLRSKLKEGWETEDARIMLARAKVWMDLLGKIRSYAEGYTPLDVPAKNLFDFRLEGFAKSVVDSVSSVNIYLEIMARRMSLLRS